MLTKLDQTIPIEGGRFDKRSLDKRDDLNLDMDTFREGDKVAITLMKRQMNGEWSSVPRDDGKMDCYIYKRGKLILDQESMDNIKNGKMTIREWVEKFDPQNAFLKTK